jgi:hypothetical protein
MNHLDALETILRSGHSLTSLERRLRLSPGYLSKVRRKVVTPSFQLAGLLALVARAPTDALAVLDDMAPPPAPALPEPPTRAGDRAILAVIAAAELLSASGIRVGVLGPRPYAPSAGGVLDLVVHDHDREALVRLRDAGFVCAHHSSALFRCAQGTERFSAHFPTLPPLSTCFARLQHREVDGHIVPVVDPVTTALWFSLSRHEDASQNLGAVLSSGLVDRAELEQALAALDALPPTSSPYVLQTFDRALAATRLAGLARSA